MPDRTQLAKYLRDLLTAQADVTATPQMPRQAQMTIGPRTGVRDPAPQSGPLAAIARSMAPSEDTPMGMVNEMFNPLRQGAAARELAGKAVGAIQRRELGRAAGLGALAAMSVPGVPGDEAIGTMRAVKHVEQIPVSELAKYREFARIPSASLLEDIRKNGIREPLMLEYSVADHALRLTEGNNRLAAAQALGLSDVPVTVIRREGAFPKRAGASAPTPVSGPRPNQRLPEQFSPSTIFGQRP